ncbi:hypothetical protein P12x_002115 [Tundrisphaera lichenicola]|uniref:hypothetical protein n=1 Tax=Tundrisphaera lichenicola TaxID=2029860 RepID=UPI003EC06C46
MAKSEAQYRLVIFDELEDPHKVRDLFAEVTGAHPTDAMQWVARVPGIWPKMLAEEQTRRLLAGLYELEIAAEAWRSDAYPDISRPRTIHEASCLEGGFRVTGLRGEPTHWVPWDKIELVATGRIATDDEFREVTPPGWVNALSTGFRAAIGRAPRTARKSRAMRITRDPVGEVLIVRRDPRLAFRVVESQMKYSYLGDRLRPSAAENFPLFVGDLRRLATDAFITPTTEALLDGGDPDDFEFASSQSLVDYATLRLLWSWYRRDRDAQDGTGESRTIS